MKVHFGYNLFREALKLFHFDFTTEQLREQRLYFDQSLVITLQSNHARTHANGGISNTNNQKKWLENTNFRWPYSVFLRHPFPKLSFDSFPFAHVELITIIMVRREEPTVMLMMISSAGEQWNTKRQCTKLPHNYHCQPVHGIGNSIINRRNAECVITWLKLIRRREQCLLQNWGVNFFKWIFCTSQREIVEQKYWL